MFSTDLHCALLERSGAHDRQIALMRYLSRFAKKLGVGKHVYVVGGAVRDFVIDQPIKDIDMMIDAVALGRGRDAAWFAKKLAAAIPVKTSLATNRYGVALLTIKEPWAVDGHQMKGETIDIATARKEEYGGKRGKGYKPSKVSYATARDDVSRREFTFNTLMWRLSQLAHGPEKAEIVDITGCGLADLKSGLMRCPSDPDKTFSDDPTRMLRAIKFLVRYNFKIDGEVEAAIRRNARKLSKAPHEAIAKLLIKTILKEKNAKKALREMKRLGLLDVVADMLRTNKGFQAAMRTWANDQRVAHLFELMDMGLPLSTKLDFLSTAERKNLRAALVGVPESEAEAYVAKLRQPGKAFSDRRYVPNLAQQRGIEGGKEMGRFAKKVSDKARELMLDRPSLASNPAKLRRAVQSARLSEQLWVALGIS